MIPLEDQDLPKEKQFKASELYEKKEHGLDDLYSVVDKLKNDVRVLEEGHQMNDLYKMVQELEERLRKLEKNQCIVEFDEHPVKKLKIFFGGEDGEYIWMRGVYPSGKYKDTFYIKGTT